MKRRITWSTGPRGVSFLNALPNSVTFSLAGLPLSEFGILKAWRTMISRQKQIVFPHGFYIRNVRFAENTANWFSNR
jgi:hypothetical protein